MFNDEGLHSYTQRAILFDLPSQDDLDQFKKIKVLLSPPGCKEVIYYPNATKRSYLEKGYVEINIGCCPDRIQSLTCNKQGQRKQYGLKHYIAGTIHSAMGDTLGSVATSISLNNNKFILWDKGQLIVIISRTKHAKDTIFVGIKKAHWQL